MHNKLLIAVLVILYAQVFVPAQESVTPRITERPRFETELVSEINQLRAKPWTFGHHISGYQALLRGDVLELPGRKPFLLFEGSNVLRIAKDNIAKRHATRPLLRSGPLNAIARAHLRDLLLDPKIGHRGRDGADFKTRIKRFANPIGPVSENITYSDITPRQAVLTMLIDDGVESRMHRENLLHPDFGLIGTACGMDESGKSICVFEFAVELATSKPRLL